MSYGGVLGVAALVIVALMLAVWVLSLVLRDASIVDIVWGLGFVVVAWVSRFTADGYEPRQNLLVALTTVWGLRLAAYLAWRNIGKGEDPRYVAMRHHWGPRFPVISLVTVFLLQGVLMWIVSLPVQIGQVPDERGAFVAMVAVGSAVWAVGMAFETVGDVQLARFKADPGSAGQVMDRGLWRYTRHPNYFGDFCVWWGIFLVAASTAPGLIAVAGPIVMSILLLRVSGVALLERSIGKRRPGYAEYAARTSAFFPRPPT